MDIIGHALRKLGEIRRIRHHPTQYHVVPIGIDKQQTKFLGQFDDQCTERQKTAALVYEGTVEMLLRHLCEIAA